MEKKKSKSASDTDGWLDLEKGQWNEETPTYLESLVDFWSIRGLLRYVFHYLDLD
jgi:hypothetical protein